MSATLTIHMNTIVCTLKYLYKKHPTTKIITDDITLAMMNPVGPYVENKPDTIGLPSIIVPYISIPRIVVMRSRYWENTKILSTVNNLSINYYLTPKVLNCSGKRIS